ncbi:MAG: PadR family transcriptional regulator [Candidatus Nanopelagicales bacterium]
MSIKQGMLALLAEGPRYGYQLRGEFEERTGGTWPLNIGQVYTTLARLERDGLIVSGGQDTEGRTRYDITDSGRAEVEGWFATPVHRDTAPRDELVIKLALALTLPAVDIRALIQAQRTETVRTLQEYTRLKSVGDADGEAWRLALDAMIFQAEAEMRWLDHCETRIAARGRALAASGRYVADGAAEADELGVAR